MQSNGKIVLIFGNNRGWREGGREGATLGEAASRARLLSSEGVVDSVRRPLGEGWGSGGEGWMGERQ